MKLLNIKNKNRCRILLIIFGFIIIVYSVGNIFINNYINKTNYKRECEKINEFFEIDDVQNDKEMLSNENENKENFIGVLEIPSINLKKGIYDKNSKNNNVNKTIYTLGETIYPTQNNTSHIFLASHSGNSNISYFKKLKELTLNNEIYFYYKGNKYIYSVSKIYEIDKDKLSKLLINQFSDISLITCVKGTNKQVVYMAKLINTQKY